MGLLDKILRPKQKPDQIEFQIATAVDDIHRRWNIQPYNPDELATRKGGLGVYRKMRLDDQVKACLQLKKSAIITPGWKLDEGEEEHQEFIEYCFSQMEGTIESFITSLLSAFDYGFSVHEKVFRYYDTGEFGGKIGVRMLKAKSPTRIDFHVDTHGNLEKVTQKQDNGQFLTLPLDKFIIYTYQKEFDNYYGESDLRAIYNQWFVKQNVIKYWAIYLERFSIPLIVGKTSGRALSDQQNAFQMLVKNIQAGMSAILPQGDLTLELLESARIDRGVFDQALQSLNVGIARGILIPQLVGLVPQAGVGSYGKSETDLKVFDWVLGAVAREVQDIISESLIRHLIDINYGFQEEYPRFVIKPMKEEDKTRLAAAWSEAVARGAVTTTLQTEHYVRELLGFPEMEGEEESTVDDALEASRMNPMEGGPSGSSGLAGSRGKVSNFPGSANQYSTRQLSFGPESRADWEKYVRELDGIEDAAKQELTDAFSLTVFGLIEDAKKKSAHRRD